jgi:penicillin amidase
MTKKRILSGLLLLVLACAVVALAGGVYAVRAPLPRHEGELTAAGLSAPVEIVRDEWGVPHIYAETAQDLFFAQGYTQAQDRWWQMEFSRRLSQGRLTELVGEPGLPEDLWIRALGLRRAAQQEIALYDDETLGYLQAFANGVNAYTQTRPSRQLAVEYTALQAAGLEMTVPLWTPVDTLVYGKFISLGLSANYGVEQDMSLFYEQFGPEMTADFFPDFPFGQKPIVLDAAELDELVAEGVRQTAAPLAAPFPGGHAQIPLPPQPPGIGSNNWVVDGRYTTSGMPLLANDPHLGISMPSIWYEVGLHCRPVGDACPFDVTGFTFVPFPGVLLGHNQHIAWGATVAGPDVQDLYRLRVDAAAPFRYEWDGRYRQMDVHDELFTFADGREPLRLTMRASHLGPVIDDYPFDAASGEPGELSEEPLALRWTALDPGTFFQAIFGLNKATNWEEFRAALSHWDFGAMNMVYADTAGNIGYQMPGQVPIRAAGHDGLTPAPGWSSEYEWQGMIPYDLLPRLFNPEDGYIVTANQNIVPPEYWNRLARQLGDGAHYNFHEKWFVYGYRAQRIEELLLAGAPHTVGSFAAMQMDNKLISAEEMAPYLAELEPGAAELTAVRDWLLEWDYQLERESGRAAFYMQFWRILLTNLYDDNLAAYDLPPASDMHMWAATLLLAEPENPWWDDVRTPNRVETRDEILSLSLEQAYSEMEREQGEDRDAWRWGEMHTATFVSQPLGSLPVLNRLVNRGPVAVDGGSNVVNATGGAGPHGDDFFAVNGLPSMRMVVDLSDLSNSVSMNTTGQSGHPFSPHYDDMIDPWREGEMKPMGMAGGETLRLVPVER